MPIAVDVDRPEGLVGVMHVLGEDKRDVLDVVELDRRSLHLGPDVALEHERGLPIARWGCRGPPENGVRGGRVGEGGNGDDYATLPLPPGERRTCCGLPELPLGLREGHRDLLERPEFLDQGLVRDVFEGFPGVERRVIALPVHQEVRLVGSRLLGDDPFDAPKLIR